MRSTFANVYDQHALLLRRIATEKFGVPAPEAEALVHDIFVTYFADPSHVREVRPYLVGAICNASRHYWRSKYYEKALFSSDESDEPVDASWVDQVSVRLTLARALSRIRPQCREALRRYYIDGETTDDIAAVMDTTRGYVFKLLSSCRKDALRACLSVTKESAACST
ncbi:MAG TPA: sigma-70 family RNA polymerase sigma factor [Thermoanaerobaculia bacterium]|nr:sigma-70 family RNA polymerase sigma factor [Thermoanaerobaculia bacterium]